MGALNQANGGLMIRYDALETQNRGYDAEPLRAWDNNPPEMVDASAFFGSPAQFLAAKGTPIKSLADQAADLVQLNGGKARVELRSPSQNMITDLTGASHRGVPTPHTRVAPRNLMAPKQPAYNTSDGKSVFRESTQQDIRTVRRYLERQ